MSIQLYPNIAKVKRNGVYQNLPGFVQQSGDADIEAMIANKETSTTAQFAHAKNSFFILNDILYQADENISVNSTIAVGTNCHVADLGHEVAELINEFDNSFELKYIWESVNLTIQNGFYYNSGTKVFNADSSRRCAVLNVKAGDSYKITTTVRPTSISGIVFFNNDTVVSSMLDGTGTETTYTEYEFTIPNGVNNIAVQCANPTDPILIHYEGYPVLKYGDMFYPVYTKKRTIYLGNDETKGTVSAGTNWTDNGDGTYTHTSGSSSVLSIGYSLKQNAIYWASFDISYTSGECVSISIGSGKMAQCYNGTSHIELALIATGNTLYFTPYESVTFTISNIKLQKIQDTGTKKEINYDCLLVDGHDSIYGFWNTLIGPDSAKNAVNSTRCIAIGQNALFALLSGNRNIGIGTFAFGSMQEGKENVSVGSDAAYQVIKGEGNVYIGMAAGAYGAECNDNTIIGRNAMQSAGNGDKNIHRNVCVGNNSGIYNYGTDNVFVGYQAGYRNRSGKSNVVIGANALWSDSGDKNTIIGSEIYTSTTNIQKSIAVGNGAIPTKSQQMILGSSDITEVVMCGNKKIIFNNDGTVTWEEVT